MRFVPKDGRAQAMRRRQLGQDLPVVVFSWGPVPLPHSRASTEHDDWQVLAELAAAHGLRTPILWDKPHVEHPFWQQIRNVW